MKIVCAAICKNEQHNVLAFIDNLHSHGIETLCIADTGSQDQTVDLLQSTSKIHVNLVQTILDPFDFSQAKNSVIPLIPHDADMVLHLDLDERVKQLPSVTDITRGYSCDRLEILYNMVSKDMPRLTPRTGWTWRHAIHEQMIPEFYIDYRPDFIIEHHQRPGKDCYEDLTAYWFEHDAERLYQHRLTDLIHNNLHSDYIELFRKYGVWNLQELAAWRAVKNYIISLWHLQQQPELHYIELLKTFSSSSTCYYICLAYMMLGQWSQAQEWYAHATTGSFDAENQRIYYNQNIKPLVEHHMWKIHST